MFHGRFGDEVTLSLDLATAGAGAGLKDADEATYRLFNTLDEEERGIGEAARLAKATLARNAKHPPRYQHPRPPKQQHLQRRSKKGRREAREAKATAKAEAKAKSVL